MPNQASQASSKDREIAMFGCTIETMRREPVFTKLDNPYSVNMYTMAILSDAQETLSRGNAEQARQFMNKAKFWLSESMELMRSQEKADSARQEELGSEPTGPGM